MITTVTGDIPKERAGFTLPHEHIFCDLRPLVSDYDDPELHRVFHEQISLRNFGHLTRNPYAVLDNAVLDDETAQTWEVAEYARAGGITIADATTRDFGRDAKKLQRVSEATGVYIVMGCGFYIDAARTPDMREMTVTQMTDELLRDLTEGVYEDGVCTGIRAGMIGEIGTSGEITPGEYRSLEAAAYAQRETGVGLHIHASLWTDAGVDAARFVLKRGVDPRKICIDHADAALRMDYVEKLLELDILVEFDNFGKEYYVDRRYRNLLEGSFATDRDRAKTVCELYARGLGDQLLITNDVCLKSCLHHWGGWGYDHIARNIVPMLMDFGMSTSETQTLTVGNPARFLDHT